MKTINIPLFLIICTLVFSCKKWSPEQDLVIARVGTDYLYKKELEQSLSGFMNPEDSIVKTRAFIDDWARKQIILQQAKMNLPDIKVSSLEKLVDQYRTELYANTYKQTIASKTIDTLINDFEVDSFLVTNQSVFKLNAPLFQIRYIHLPENNVDESLIENSFVRYNEEDQHFLDSLSFQYTHYILDKDLWLNRNDLLSQVSFLTQDKLDRYLKKSQFFKEKDALGVYLFVLNNFLEIGELPPREVVEKTIRNIIMNQRRLEFTKKFEFEILQDAIKSKTYEIY